MRTIRNTTAQQTIQKKTAPKTLIKNGIKSKRENASVLLYRNPWCACISGTGGEAISKRAEQEKNRMTKKKMKYGTSNMRKN